MQAFSLETSLIKPKDNLVNMLIQAVKRRNLKLEDKDVIAISSKAVAMAQGRIVELHQVAPSKEARTLAEKHSLQPQFAELIIQEAEQIYGGVEKAVLTLKNGILTVNAGIDRKNAPSGHVVLWPIDPQQHIENIRNEIRQKAGKRVGVLVVDSDVAPLRLGTRGLAVAVAGFEPVKDCRDEKDLYQKPLLITRHAIADDLASLAHLLMGETSEKTPFVLIRDAPVTFTDERVSSEEMGISSDKCVYASAFKISAANLETVNP